MPCFQRKRINFSLHQVYVFLTSQKANFPASLKGTVDVPKVPGWCQKKLWIFFYFFFFGFSCSRNSTLSWFGFRSEITAQLLRVTFLCLWALAFHPEMDFVFWRTREPVGSTVPPQAAGAAVAVPANPSWVISIYKETTVCSPPKLQILL